MPVYFNQEHTSHNWETSPPRPRFMNNSAQMTSQTERGTTVGGRREAVVQTWICLALQPGLKKTLPRPIVLNCTSAGGSGGARVGEENIFCLLSILTQFHGHI